MEKENKNRFWKGVLVGSLVTAFSGLLIVGIATGISLIGRTVIDKQVQARGVEDSREAGTGAALSQELNLDEIQKKMNFLQQIIDQYFLFDEDSEKVEAGIYAGMLAGLDDPYSTYYTAEEYQQMRESTEGIYPGIGAMVSQDRQTKLVTIVKVFKGSPSQEAGLLPGDIIYTVGDVEANTMDLDLLVSKHIRGMEGTVVNMTVVRQNEYVDLKIVRRQIEVPTVEYQLLEDKTGYLIVSQFDLVTPAQFAQAIDQLTKDKMERLVIDMRGNPGGVLDSAVEMAAYVLPEDRMDGMIVYTKDKYEKGSQYFSQGGQIKTTADDGRGKDPSYPKKDNHQVDVPIALLINENSASASEVFAGCIKDYEWGTLVGTKTYGKGIVQNLIPLDDGTAIKITTSHYFTPSGFDLHEKGIGPDVEVELNEELRAKITIAPEEDNQLQKAIEVLKEAS